MKLKEIGIVLAPTFRAMAYLQRLVKNNLYTNFAIVMVPKNRDFIRGISKENKLNFFDEFEDFE